MKDALTPKQRKFVNEYLIDLNATQAAIRAGYSAKTANEQGAQNLAKLSIKSEIEKGQNKVALRASVTVEMIIDELKKIGFSSITDYISFNGGKVILKDSEAIPKDKIAAIAEVSKTISEGGSTLKFKLYDKISALDKLARHLGMYVDKADEKPIQSITAIKVIIEYPNGDGNTERIGD